MMDAKSDQTERIAIETKISVLRQELINQKISIQPIIVEGEWYEIDTLQDLKNVRMKYF